jgi:hypothetical protein
LTVVIAQQQSPDPEGRGFFASVNQGIFFASVNQGI